MCGVVCAGVCSVVYVTVCAYILTKSPHQSIVRLQYIISSKVDILITIVSVRHVQASKAPVLNILLVPITQPKSLHRNQTLTNIQPRDYIT